MVVGENILDGLWFETWSCIHENIHPYTEGEKEKS
jgi:hypothetical protein